MGYIFCQSCTLGIRGFRASEGIVNRLDGKCGFSVCEKTGSNRAKPFAQKYIKLVEDTYVKTEKLWEKYDAVEMLGWTAGVYLYFLGKNM